ncbi:UNVERIFIED_CONTAM: hypothetical protein FKN15_077881 [Acipenser sinensis]
MCYNVTSNITERYTLIKTQKTWTEAQKYCKVHHTDLVSVKSDSENEDIVKKAQGSPFWIGLFNEPWKWADGENSTFRNWDSGYPSNYGVNSNCTVIYGKTQGKWRNYPCRNTFPFICYGGKYLCPVWPLFYLSAQ